MKRHSYRLRAIWLALSVALLFGLSGLSVAPSSHAAEGASVAVTVWPEPSLQAVPGHLLTYRVRAKNFGGGEASRVEVRLPYNQSVLTVQDATFDDGRTWVSAINDDNIEVTFLDLDKNEQHTAWLVFRVSDVVPMQTVLPMWAAYRWEEDDGDEVENQLSNAAPVVVGPVERTNPNIVMMVEPERGLPGTIFTFTSDRFFPDEEISVWLNTTTLPVDLDLDLRSDAQGRIWLALPRQDLPPGPYSLVFYGSKSGLTGVGAFIVEDPASN